jgi:hypothetical protein
MRVFIFSKRFIIPFFVSFIFYISCTLWYFWELYKDDIVNKNVPLGLKLEWLMYTAGGQIGVLCFVFAFLVGILFFVHHSLKVSINPFHFFSKHNNISVLTIAFIAFLYVSYLQPAATYRSSRYLVDFIFTKAGETFVRTEGGYRNEKMLSFSQLLIKTDSLDEAMEKHRKAIIRKIKMNIAESEADKVVIYLSNTAFPISRGDLLREDIPFSSEQSWECCVKDQVPGDIAALERQIAVNRRFELSRAEMIACPLHIFLFYIAGILLGTLTKKLAVVFPLLIVAFILIPLWYYGQQFFNMQFLQRKSGMFITAFWPFVIGVLLLLFWWMMVKRQNMLRDYHAPEN